MAPGPIEPITASARAVEAVAKTAEKFLDVISKGIGGLGRGYTIRRDAKALADARVVEAKGEAEVLKVQVAGKVDAVKLIAEAASSVPAEQKLLIERTMSRFLHQEQSKQRNIESIIHAAQEELPPQASDEPVDIDWITDFFERAAKVSKPEMQKVWGKILSREVTNPGAFHPRTLAALQNLTAQEARLFELATSFSTREGEILLPHASGYELLAKHGLAFDQIINLETAGLLTIGADLQAEWVTSRARDVGDGGRRFTIALRNGRIWVNTKEPKIFAATIRLSKAGVELMSLLPANTNREYFSELRPSVVSGPLTTWTFSWEEAAKEMM